MGVFFRLFTLLEDECHKLDLELAASETAAPSTSDKEIFKTYMTLVQKERELLDQKKNLSEQVTWLEQTLSLLLLAPSSSNLPAQAVATAIKERKEKIIAIVRLVMIVQITIIQ